jgi:uroporphyrinogen-III synthase
MKTPVFFIGEKLSAATRQWLQKQQVQFIEEPFLRTEYKKPNLAFFNTMANSPKQWVIASVYAAHWLLRFHEQIGITENDRLYCWSDKEAELLKKLDLPVVVSSFSNVLELVGNVTAQNQGESVLFLHGDKLHGEICSAIAEFSVQFTDIEVYKNTSIEKFVNGIFDAYLFFNPMSIDNFKASGNFTSPKSLVLANENSTAREAWRVLDNKVYLSPDQEELSFVQYSVERWKQENNSI